MSTAPPDANRDSRRDAILSAAVLVASALVFLGNLICVVFSDNASHETGRRAIAIGLGCGVCASIALSARVFFRHRINLGAWMLMFGINAIGMLLATQLFQWLHPVVGKAVGKMNDANARSMAFNVLLLALGLAAALLVRSAALLKNAARMPAWMAARAPDASATPRLWLFALFWITPIAWWGLILCALYFIKLSSDEAFLRIAAAVCVAIVVTRIAVRIVLFEKNKFTSWRRRPTGGELWLKRMNSAGLALAGALTFYAYFYMTTRVQEDAFVAQLQVEREMLQSELDEFKTEPVPPNENAETIFKLARTSVVPINWDWAEENWNTPEAALEVAKNLTALSYFRQGAARKAIDFGIDWTNPQSGITSIQRTGYIAVAQVSLLEMRIAAGNGDWTKFEENFETGLSFARLSGEALDYSMTKHMTELEEQLVATVILSFFEPSVMPSDQTLLSSQEVLKKHFLLRGDYNGRSRYREHLTLFADISRAQVILNASFGYIDVHSNLNAPPLITWTAWRRWFSALPILKLLVRQRLDWASQKDIFVQSQALASNPSFFKSILRDVDIHAKLRLLEAAIGAKRYQRFYGHWPSELKDCEPQFMAEIPPDPFVNGEKIHYLPSPPRVFSAGSNGKYEPDSHGFPRVDRFKKLSMDERDWGDSDVVLFLGN